ncbi:EF-hand domain pair domain-containing protein [Ditylenchus destructor]|nr:EF-hand domain pair domain-containing protein [Ditylenchus destructor]
MKADQSASQASSSNPKISRQELEEVFAQFDEEKTGFVSTKKLKTVLRALGFEPRQHEIEEMLSRIKANEAARAVNEDGLSMEELLYLLKDKTVEVKTSDEISSAFRLFDVEGKGYINVEDLRRISKELGETIPEEELQEMVRDANISKNGRVTEPEFKVIMKKTALY